MSDERLTVMQRSAVTLIPGSPITAWRTDVISADCSVGYRGSQASVRAECVANLLSSQLEDGRRPNPVQIRAEGTQLGVCLQFRKKRGPIRELHIRQVNEDVADVAFVQECQR